MQWCRIPNFVGYKSDKNHATRVILLPVTIECDMVPKGVKLVIKGHKCGGTLEETLNYSVQGNAILTEAKNISLNNEQRHQRFKLLTFSFLKQGKLIFASDPVPFCNMTAALDKKRKLFLVTHGREEENVQPLKKPKEAKDPNTCKCGGALYITSRCIECYLKKQTEEIAERERIVEEQLRNLENKLSLVA